MHLGGLVTPWSSEEMLAGQRQRVDVLYHARTAQDDLLWKWLEEDLCWIAHRVPPTTRSVKGLNWTYWPDFTRTYTVEHRWLVCSDFLKLCSELAVYDIDPYRVSFRYNLHDWLGMKKEFVYLERVTKMVFKRGTQWSCPSLQVSKATYESVSAMRQRCGSSSGDAKNL